MGLEAIPRETVSHESQTVRHTAGVGELLDVGETAHLATSRGRGLRSMSAGGRRRGGTEFFSLSGLKKV